MRTFSYTSCKENKRDLPALESLFVVFGGMLSVDGEKRSNCDNCLGLAEKFCGH